MQQATVAQFREHALDSSRNGEDPSFLRAHSPTRSGIFNIFAISRDDAAEHFGSTLFTHDVCTISVSSVDGDRKRVDPYLPEILASIYKLLGEQVPPLLREVTVAGGSVTYFKVLIDGARFYAPSPLQDAYLAKHLDARPLTAQA